MTAESSIFMRNKKGETERERERERERRKSETERKENDWRNAGNEGGSGANRSLRAGKRIHRFGHWARLPLQSRKDRSMRDCRVSSVSCREITHTQRKREKEKERERERETKALAHKTHTDTHGESTHPHTHTPTHTHTHTRQHTKGS